MKKGNGGRMKESGTRGQRFQTDYGRDNSTSSGSASDERGKALPGGIHDLGHSLAGASVATVKGVKGNEGRG